MSLEKNENLVEKTLLQIKSIEEAISENAKGILASTMKEEISELVKESLFGTKSKSSLHEQEEDDTEEVVGVETDTEVADDSEETTDVDTDVNPEGDELDITMMGSEVPTDNEDELPPLDMTGAKPDEVLKVFKAMGDEDGIIVVKDDNKIHLTDTNNDTEYFIDLGNDSDISNLDDMEDMNESVIYELVFEEDEKMGKHEMEEDYMEEEVDEEIDETIYELEVSESMKPVGMGFGKMKNGLSKSSVNNKGFDEDMEDGMKSEKKGKGPKFNYGKIKHGVTESEMEEEYMEEGWMDEEMIDDMKTESDYMEGDYMEGDYMEGDDMFGGNKHDYKRRDGHKMGDVDGHYKDYEMEEGDYMEDAMVDELPGETTEASRTMTYMRRAQRDRVAAPSQLRKESVEKELNLLKEKNEEYKKALDFFRNKLNEVAVFNSNLAYSTRLFTEHSTTKQEKINILRRFDNVETIKESKSLYKSIKSELEGGSKSNEVVSESVQRKLVSTPSNGSASNLIESKTYENPQFLRMKDLMGKIK
jgi:hypothetical protein